MDGRDSLKIGGLGALIPGMMAHTVAQRCVFSKILTELEKDRRESHFIRTSDKIYYYAIGAGAGIVDLALYLTTGYEVVQKLQSGENYAAAGIFLGQAIARGIATGAMHRSSTELNSLITKKVWRWD